ncbi:short-subunit dehydrogenase [Dokdonella fugitiva]|uniref:Short-subunit dehydrogenase n=1 Tax=Dokdonella fugitiva TaxID=328517 RepID=A0A839F6E8_9GAMM|nr:SDR family NAD(P)-dependent oxidoreductase [Dokdonella fugitiva]MBA8887751.1 short-subunit dehydrogenase [Dokdonella fugitiva]
MTAVVVGASSGLGRALANELARCGHALLLVASDLRDIDAIAADLRIRHGATVRSLALDLAREADPGARVAAALEGLPPLASVLLPVGLSRADDDFGLDAARIGELLAINLHAPFAIAHALLPRLREARGVIVLFSSIAAVRGRGRNVVYAAAKRGIESLYESLRQRHRETELRVQLYRLGFLATNLTHGLALPMPAAAPDDVARLVVERLRRGSARWYLPRRFALVAMVVRLLPWPLFRRMQS